MDKINLENLVIMNRIDYDMDIKEINMIKQEKALNDKVFKIYYDFFWKTFKEKNDYDFRNIDEFTLEDYHFRDLVSECLALGLSDIDYIKENIIKLGSKDKEVKDE